MAEGVIHILELVDIDHEDAERRVVAARALHFRSQLREQRATIEQLRKRIGAGEGLEAQIISLGYLDHMGATHRVHGALYHCLREFDVSGGQRWLLRRTTKQKHAGAIEIESEGKRNDRADGDHAPV